MPPILPPAEISRRRLVNIVRDLDFVKRKAGKGDIRQLLIFTYSLAMQVSNPLPCDRLVSHASLTAYLVVLRVSYRSWTCWARRCKMPLELLVKQGGTISKRSSSSFSGDDAVVWTYFSLAFTP